MRHSTKAHRRRAFFIRFMTASLYLGPTDCEKLRSGAEKSVVLKIQWFLNCSKAHVDNRCLTFDEDNLNLTLRPVNYSREKFENFLPKNCLIKKIKNFFFKEQEIKSMIWIWKMRRPWIRRQRVTQYYIETYSRPRSTSCYLSLNAALFKVEINFGMMERVIQ